MADKPEQGKPDLESWVLGTEPPPVQEASNMPPAPDPPPILPGRHTHPQTSHQVRSTEQGAAPVRKEEPRVDTDPGPQPPARPRLTRPDSNIIVTPPPPPVYSGPTSGVINWSGHLDKNGAVVIEGPTTQSGTVNGSLPGVPVMIDVDTKEFAIAEAPSPSNGWKRLVIRSRRKVHSVVTIRWT